MAANGGQPDLAVQEKVRAEVLALTKQFPIYA